MSRSFGWTLLTTRSPIEMVPEVMFSRPASIRSKVDLPQPEGPTSTTNSPSSIGIDTPCKTSKLPNDFRTSRICTDDIGILSPQFSVFGRCWPEASPISVFSTLMPPVEFDSHYHRQFGGI